jgi:predicted naringenin-chalcone synthase
METIPMAIRASAAELGERFCSLEAVGLDPAQFKDLNNLYLTKELPLLVRKAANTALAAAAVAPDEVDLLLYIAALPESQMARPDRGKFLDRFSYIGTWLQHELGLVDARTIGIGQQGCSALFAALELAQANSVPTSRFATFFVWEATRFRLMRIESFFTMPSATQQSR